MITPAARNFSPINIPEPGKNWKLELEICIAIVAMFILIVICRLVIKMSKFRNTTIIHPTTWQTLSNTAIKQAYAKVKGLDPEIDDRIPVEFCCPITLQLMFDPVVDAVGETYDRAAIERHFINKLTDPVTNLELETDSLIPNLRLRQIILGFFEKIIRDLSMAQNRAIRKKPSHDITTPGVQTRGKRRFALRG